MTKSLRDIVPLREISKSLVLAKEESLDEISKSTLKSYYSKALAHRKELAKKAVRQSLHDEPGARKTLTKEKKRYLGAVKAHKKIEESLDEGAQEDNFDRYHKNATEYASKISDLLSEYAKHHKSNNKYIDTYNMKDYYRNLEDIHDRLCSTVENAANDAKYREKYNSTLSPIKEESIWSRLKRATPIKNNDSTVGNQSQQKSGLKFINKKNNPKMNKTEV